MKRFTFGLIVALTIIATTTSLVLPENPSVTSVRGESVRHSVIDVFQPCESPGNEKPAFDGNIRKRQTFFLDELKRAEPVIVRTLTGSENNRKLQKLQDALNNLLEDMLGVTDNEGMRDRDREDGTENDRRLPLMDQRERDETT